MNDVVRKDILAVLNGLAGILEVKEEKDIIEIKNLSDRVIHNASIFQDEYSVSVAIFVYSLSKIIERMYSQLDYKKLIGMVKKTADFLQQNDEKNFGDSIKEIFRFISSMDSKVKKYVGEVITQAQIKKGSKLYAHGISAARAAEVLGISQWELLNYIGNTTMMDRFEDNVGIKKRLANARVLFAK